MQEKVIIFSAPSGAGKTTIVKHLLEKFPILEFSVSATSRKPRANEIHGKDYYFISSEEFQQRIGESEFVEWEEVYSGCYYGTLREELQKIWKNKHMVVFDVDVKGGMNLKTIFGEQAMSVFISPPSIEILEQRLRNRSTESEESITKRVGKAEWEMQFANEFDKIIVNNNLEDSYKEAEAIINDWVKKAS